MRWREGRKREKGRKEIRKERQLKREEVKTESDKDAIAEKKREQKKAE